MSDVPGFNEENDGSATVCQVAEPNSPKKLIFVVLDPKGAEMGLKWGFSSFMKNWPSEPFRYFT